MYICDLECANDMVLVSDLIDVLEELLKTLIATCSRIGLSITIRKAKILAIYPSNSHIGHPREVYLKPDKEPVMVVKELEYLGSIISQDCTLDREIRSRISKASYVFLSLFRVPWSKGRLKVATKMCLVKSVVLPTLPYGRETWVPLATHQEHLQALIMKFVGVIVGELWGLWELFWVYLGGTRRGLLSCGPGLV